MKELLLKYHEGELSKSRVALSEWMKGPDGYVDEKTCQNGCDRFSMLVDFHKKAIEWLESLE